jgi:hypothetical protein
MWACKSWLGLEPESLVSVSPEASHIGSRGKLYILAIVG